MESFLQKYNWAINLALIGASTLLAALLINAFIASQLAQFTVPKIPSFQQSAGGGERMMADDGERDLWVDALARRCLFGCPEIEDPDICPDGCPDGEICEMGKCVPDEFEDGYEEYDDGIPRLTELNVKLTGVMAAHNPRWSMAMIRNDDSNETHVVGVGDKLPGEAPVEILEIRRDRVFVENNGVLEFIRLEDSPHGDPQPASGRERSSNRSSDRRAMSQERQERAQRAAREAREEVRPERGGIQESGDNQYSVDRSRIEEAISDPETLSREARIMPNYNDGEPSGLRLVGVRPNSLYSELGIRSGDVLHSVDGSPLTNQRQAQEMLESMGKQDSVTIQVERRGRMQEMEYNIK